MTKWNSILALDAHVVTEYNNPVIRTWILTKDNINKDNIMC